MNYDEMRGKQGATLMGQDQFYFFPLLTITIAFLAIVAMLRD